MRRFVALSLSFLIFFSSISNFAFADLVKATTSSNLIRTKVIKLDPGLISDDNEDIYAIRLIQVEAISPENLPLRSRIVTKLENRAFNWDRWDLLKSILSAIIGAGICAVMSFFGIGNLWRLGVFGGPTIYNTYKYLERNENINTFKTNFSKASVDVVLIPISEKAAKILSEKYVCVGEMKQSLKDYKNQMQAVNAENGISDLDDLKIKVVQKAKNGAYASNVDPFDPFDLVGTGRIFNIKPEVSSRNPNDFYNKKETEEKNTKIDQEQNKVLTGLKKIMDEELIDPSNFKDNSWNLTKKNPTLSFVVAAVNCGEKADALKLSLKRKLSYPNPLTMDKLLFNFGANIDFDASDNKKYEEILAELSDSWLTSVLKKIKGFFWEKEENTEEKSAEEVHFAQKNQAPPGEQQNDQHQQQGGQQQHQQNNQAPPGEQQQNDQHQQQGGQQQHQQNNQAPPDDQQQENIYYFGENGENQDEETDNSQPQNFDDPNDERYSLGLKNPFD